MAQFHTKFHIDEVCPKGSVYPIVVSFQNVYVTEKFNSQNCLLLEDEKTGVKNIITELCDTIYTGEEENEDLGKTLILARNKTTGKVRLIEIEDIELKPVTKFNFDTTELMDTKYFELNKKFGSKKHKQVMEQHQKFKFNVQTVTEHMQNVADSISEHQLDLSSCNKVVPNEFYIPAINREATKVEEVYDIDTILTPEQFEKIYSEIEGAEFTSNLNTFLKSIGTKTLSQKHTVLLVYANTLLQLYGKLMKDISKNNFKACQYSVTLNEIVMKNFTNIYAKKGRPSQYKDKCLCHALVFILLINNYKLNYDDLCQQLKLTHRTVSSKVALTGATLVSVGGKKVAQLSLPMKDNIKSKRNTIKSISHGNELVCKLCNYKGINNNDMKRHSLCPSSLCFKEKPYKCDICQKDFKRKDVLKKHILTHMGEKSYKCDICHRCFNRSDKLTAHISKHTGVKPYKCSICESSYKSKRSLMAHNSKHTGVKPYNCDICQRRFNLKAGLKIHIRTHTGEKRHKCDTCQSRFNFKVSLTAHIISKHTGVKPYNCDVCQRRFSTKARLKSHFRTHTDEKPYKCDICPSKFNQKPSLTKHIFKHTGEKPYKCDICHSRFYDKIALTTHISNHTGVKPYKCNICESSFNSKRSLIAHNSKHTGIKPYNCDICQRGFSLKAGLKNHIRTHTARRSKRRTRAVINP